MPPGDYKKIVDAAKVVHGGLTGLLRLADEINSGHEQYVAKHWGQPADKRRVRQQPLPRVDEGLVELGELVSLVYLTRKGRDGEGVEYEHEFEDTLPTLTFAPDGSGLVIVRGRSKYTVTNRGIEG